jgi:hypothetical protein
MNEEFWLRSPVKVNQHLGGIYHPHVQGRRVSQASYQHEAGSQ